MKTSLILCAKNGGARMQTCLDHMDALHGPDDLEIILVDNDSTDGVSYAMMTRFAENTKFKCKVMQCFAPGNGAGRNAALAAATGDLILFTDADCYLARDFVTAWVSIFESGDLGFASGRIMCYNPSYSMLGCNESMTKEIIPAYHFVPRGFIQGSNMAFTRKSLDRAGLFDERFGAGTPYAGEEWELALRCSFAGFSGGYFPEPSVAHDHQRPDDTARERLLFYDYGGGAVYAKHLVSRNIITIIKIIGRESRNLLSDKTRLKTLWRGMADYYLKNKKTV